MKSSFLFLLFAFSQDPTIRVTTQLVSVPVAVTSENGSPIKKLRDDDFSLSDNGRAQRFQLESANAKLSLAIVIQTSDSVRTWLPEVRRTASLIEASVLGTDGEASVITFNDEVTVGQELTSNMELVDVAFRALRLTGTKVRCLDAVALAANQLLDTPPDRRRVILLITQAGDAGSSAALPDVLQTLSRNNISVYSLTMPRIGKDLIGKTVRISGTSGKVAAKDTGIMVGIDLGKLMPEIYRSAKTAAAQDYVTILTTETGGRGIPFGKLRELEAALAHIGEELHSSYLLTFTPDPPTPGDHRLSVRVNRPMTAIRARAGYYVQ